MINNLVIPHWLGLMAMAAGLTVYAVSCFLFGKLTFEIMWRLVGWYMKKELKRKF